MIVDKKLTVSNRKKVDIVMELRSKQFRPFSKASKAKAAGETEEIVEADEEEAALPGNSSDYDYLLGMAIWSLTKEKVLPRLIAEEAVLMFHQIEKLRLQANEKETELMRLLEKSPVEVWSSDLDTFLEHWEVCCLGGFVATKF